MTGALLMWSEDLLGYDLGDHPLDPVRLELTMALSRELGVLERDGVRVEAPQPASDEMLQWVHTPAYLAAVKSAVEGLTSHATNLRHGLGTPDNPIFPFMHEASALVVGATTRAAEAVWSGEAGRAVSIAGGLHHAMPDRASGFCVYNDLAVAIARMLQLGAERVAYVDVDVHHGDGVQDVFYDDPRVLTVSLHESPLTQFPGTGFADETGGPAAPGSAVNVALPSGTGDLGWLRAFHAVVPQVLRAFRPQVLVTQCGADSHVLDPLANLALSVDGQRASYLALKRLADELCQGRWLATGGGGYALAEVVPRSWTHLLALATGAPINPFTPTPPSWQAFAKRRCPGRRVFPEMTDQADIGYLSWTPDGRDRLDKAITATRTAVFPLLGLDPLQPPE